MGTMPAEAALARGAEPRRRSAPERVKGRPVIRRWEMGDRQVLDVGSGTGVLAMELANWLPGLEVVAGDLRRILQSVAHASRGRWVP